MIVAVREELEHESVSQTNDPNIIKILIIAYFLF